MQTYRYPASLTQVSPDDVEVRFRDVPEAVTWGDTQAQALAKADDCLAAAMEGYIAEGRGMPAPSAPEQGEHLIALDWTVAARALLADAMRRENLSKVAVGHILNKDEKAVRQMLKGERVSLEAILAALKKLGVHPVLAVEDAPVVAG